MVLVIPDYVFIANALYAKKTNFLSYDEIDKYYTILYQTLNKEYKYIDFNFSSDNYIKKGNHLFIKLKDGIQSFYDVTLESIKYINSIYHIKTIELIEKSRDKFSEETKKVKNKMIKKGRW